jgi:hypothetical protein
LITTLVYKKTSTGVHLLVIFFIAFEVKMQKQVQIAQNIDCIFGCERVAQISKIFLKSEQSLNLVTLTMIVHK